MAGGASLGPIPSSGSLLAPGRRVIGGREVPLIGITTFLLSLFLICYFRARMAVQVGPLIAAAGGVRDYPAGGELKRRALGVRVTRRRVAEFVGVILVLLDIEVPKPHQATPYTATMGGPRLRGGSPRERDSARNSFVRDAFGRASAMMHLSGSKIKARGI